MRATADLIECAKGWQAELHLPRNWMLFSTVYPDKSRARKAAQVIAKRLNIDIKWCQAAEAEEGE